MKPHHTRTRPASLLIMLPALVTLILLSSPLVPPAGAAETPTTAELLTQAGEMDLSAPATEPQTAATPAESQTGTTPAATTAATTPAATPTDSGTFDAAQLEQLVAPIALYPDALLMQILMAATYPLEIVEADRWIRDKPDLKGEALDKALLEQDWDPSVESLTTLPSVLKQMSENLDWTQDLGDAFLAQENDLLDTVQRMRGKAYEAGNLVTTEQQTVTQQADKIIVIESASPEVVYVPTYSPTVVYGPAWGYPSYYYPSYYYPPAPGYGFVAFSAGIVVGAAIWGGCNWGWGHNDVNIDIDRHNEFNRNTNNNFDRDRSNTQGGRGEGGKGAWQHDSSHRKGVNYNNSSVAQKHGASAGSNRVTKSQARGHSSATASNRAGTGAQAGNRGSAASRPGAATANRGTGGSSATRSPSAANRSSGGSSAFSGSRSPSTDRASSSRGASSRGATSYGGSRGGASRGGGRRR
jgi:hypothetical protein